jgi:hypothetical protein
MRRMTTSSAAPVGPPSAVVNGFAASEHGADESDAGTHVSSRRASWMKRLSTISVSQHSSTTHSPTLLSPAVSCSNGSVAFSHDGSTVPIVDRQTPPQLPPNKLVKRSSSSRGPLDIHSAHGSGSSSLRHSFRRPATSHQRSATLQNYHSLLPVTRESPSFEVKPSSASTDSEAEYTQFFTAKSLRGRTLSKRFNPNITRVKRIFPDEKHRPTLVMARAVTASAEDLEDSASEAGESVFYVSRPGTPLSYSAAVAAPKPGAPHFTENTHVRPSTAVSSNVAPEDVSRRRRSFSIADLLPTSGFSAKKQRLAKPSMKLTRGSSQRVRSDPVIPTMGKRSNTTHTQGALPERRNLTDPAPPKRDIFASTGIAESINHHDGASGGSSTSPLSALPPPRRAMTVPGNRLASMPQLEAIASAAPATNQAPPSPSVLAQAGVRPSRHSIAPSEQASTLVGSSDNEVRAVGSVDEDDADFRSETLYDSLRTGARSVSGARGPRIETIFDESPPAKVKVTALRDLLPSGTFTDDLTNGTSGDHSIAEDDESIITPVRTVRPERYLQEAVSFSRPNSTSAFPSLIPSSPPGMSKPLSLGTLEWDSTAGDDDSSSRWSLDEQEGEDPWVDRPPASHLATPITLRRSNPRLLASVPTSKPTTPQHLTLDHVDRDARSSIFDWSEQPAAPQSSGNRTPPRPRTVHGKKDANRRDSRSVGRRAPSGLHTRSQSVPVVPDVVGKRSTVVTNKFGTWGIGSKGVTEDWNDDFDFSELAEEATPKSVAGSQRIDSGSAMVVPKSIQEQQNNVLANISLLRDWGLLIEELKEHKVRAIALGIVDGPQSGMWEEVDAMIDLADQEAEHEEVPQATPPSSPGFDEDAFDDVSGSPNVGRGRRKLGSPNDDLSNTKTVRPRKSILPPNDRIFGPQTSSAPTKPKYEAPATPESRPITRPRKDSEAKARSVIEALQFNRRSVFESPAPAAPTPSPKKVPFDTATLRRIVPYVNGLTQKVKYTIREAEGLYYSPTTSPQHEEAPFIMSPFQVDAELTAHMKLMTVM